MRGIKKWMIAIAGRLWAFWALCLFISTVMIALLFYLPCYLMQEPALAKWHRHVSRVWMNFYLFCIGCPLMVQGERYFEKGKHYIVVCNHNSFMDVPVTTPFMPNANKTIAKKEFASIPVFGWIYGLGAILVDRKSEASRKRSYHQMKQTLSMGLDMVIYPEGTRNRTSDPLKPFYDGAFKLSVDTGVPVIPALIFNTRKVMPPTKPFFLLPHMLEMHFLPPVYPQHFASIAAFKEAVHQQMTAHYTANNVT